MSVLKRNQQESDFEVYHQYHVMRRNITELMLHNFGFSNAKMEKMLSKYFRGKPKDKLTEQEITSYNRYREKLVNYIKYFIPDERKAITDLMRELGKYLHTANDIYPTYMSELEERRLYQEKAIGICDALKQELQYAIETIPVDINKYTRIAELIDREIALIKGWRKKDNRLVSVIAKAEAKRKEKMNKAKSDEKPDIK
ncbi:MAG: hypothetical protein LUI87_02335 [Lachnospiraceae bacterium]|nr:hypothetical protein [Lachnospiraceae bacterium]